MAKDYSRTNREIKKQKQPKKASNTAYAQMHSKSAAAPSLVPKKK